MVAGATEGAADARWGGYSDGTQETGRDQDYGETCQAARTETSDEANHS